MGRTPKAARVGVKRDRLWRRSGRQGGTRGRARASSGRGVRWGGSRAGVAAAEQNVSREAGDGESCAGLGFNFFTRIRVLGRDKVWLMPYWTTLGPPPMNRRGM
jgi:hypothetical protein